MNNKSTNRKSLSLLIAFMLMLTAIACLFTGCAKTPAGSSSGKPSDSKTEEPTENYEFLFTGASDFNGTTYNLTVTGNKDSGNSVTVAIKEMPEVTFDGRWVLVANKGYKIYFNDANESFVYTKFDAASKELSFKYNVNLGGAYGSAKVTFKYKSEAFAATYDGKGLGPVPPTFTGKGDGGEMKVDVTLSCYEDGTCVSAYGTRTTRNGTWSYDEAMNTYNFVFEPLVNAVYHWWYVDGVEITDEIECPADQAYDDGNEYSTTYDEATGTYNLSYWQECRSYIKCRISYIPD